MLRVRHLCPTVLVKGGIIKCEFLIRAQDDYWKAPFIHWAWELSIILAHKLGIMIFASKHQSGIGAKNRFRRAGVM